MAIRKNFYSKIDSLKIDQGASIKKLQKKELKNPSENKEIQLSLATLKRIDVKKQL